MKVTDASRNTRTKEKEFILEYSDGTVMKRRFRDIILCEDPFFTELSKPLDFNYDDYEQIDYNLLSPEEQHWVDRYHTKTSFHKIEFVSTFDILPFIQTRMSIAKNTPKQKRMCWCCNKTARNGHLFCLSHCCYEKFINYLTA